MAVKIPRPLSLSFFCEAGSSNYSPISQEAAQHSKQKKEERKVGGGRQKVKFERTCCVDPLRQFHLSFFRPP